MPSTSIHIKAKLVSTSLSASLFTHKALSLSSSYGEYFLFSQSSLYSESYPVSDAWDLLVLYEIDGKCQRTHSNLTILAINILQMCSGINPSYNLEKTTMTLADFGSDILSAWAV